MLFLQLNIGTGNRCNEARNEEEGGELGEEVGGPREGKERETFGGKFEIWREIRNLKFEIKVEFLSKWRTAISPNNQMCSRFGGDEMYVKVSTQVQARNANANSTRMYT
jgi:hypothetical protein